MRLRKEFVDLNEEEILLTAKVSDAFAHPARIQIFRFIFNQNRSREPVCNKDVVAEFAYSQATISQHIKKLAMAGLVQIKKDDKFSYYYVNLGVLGKYVDTIRKFN